jgi:hypothetical protein
MVGDTMRSALIPAMALLAGPTFAQLATPDFTSTFKSPSLTRGYLFQAPVDFFVTGVQVPDEANAGTQATAIYAESAKPPMFQANRPGKPVWFGTGKSSEVLAVWPPLRIAKGNWFCVVGATGSTSSVHSSYGANAPWTSSVLGNKVILGRFITQTNIFRNKGVAPISSSTGPVSRVRVFVQGHGSATAYGPAKRGSILTSDPFPPSIGKNAQFKVKPGAGTNHGALLLLSLARLRPFLPTQYGPLHAGLPLFALLFTPVVPAIGIDIQVQLPNNPSLVGAVLTHQAAIIEFPNVSLTNGLDWTIGR